MTMTMTTEELKREMYVRLAAFKIYATTLEAVEDSLEAYLEALRQEIQVLTVTRSSIIEERDAAMRKLQAFEFANKSAGELLRDALATVKRQRQFIRTLYTSRKARKSVGSTSAQSSAGNTRCRSSGSRAATHSSICQHSFEFDSVLGFRRCVFCMTSGNTEEA